jgi:hypothetical protein
MTRNFFLSAMTILAMVLAAPMAQAAYIDFTSDYWSEVNNPRADPDVFTKAVWENSSVSLTLKATANPDLCCSPRLTQNYSNPTDGIGIAMYGDSDEIDADKLGIKWSETLSISFSATLTMTSFTVANLFEDEVKNPGLVLE